MRVLFVVAVALVSVATPGSAQATAVAGPIRTAVWWGQAQRPAFETVVVRPTIDYAAVTPRRSQKWTGRTLMLIGAGSIVVGAVVGGKGGSVLIVGGAVCAGYGFYLHSQ